MQLVFIKKYKYPEIFGRILYDNEKSRGGILMVELDRLVKLLVEKLLRSSKKPEPSGTRYDEEKVAEPKPPESILEETAKDETDKKMPEG